MLTAWVPQQLLGVLLAYPLTLLEARTLQTVILTASAKLSPQVWFLRLQAATLLVARTVLGLQHSSLVPLTLPLTPPDPWASS